VEYIIQELDDRKEELDAYLKLIEYLNNSQTISNEKGDQLEVTSLLIKTTKGSVYLLLYNLIEASMRGAVVTIHDSISASGVAFDKLREELQEKILIRARKDKISIPKLVSNLGGSISTNLHQATLISKDLFSGNIDRDEIKSVADIYGFSTSTNYLATGHGRHLAVVKRNRNGLSHGNVTFSGVGGRTPIEELRVLVDEVISYMYEISDNIVDSLERKLYLKV